ncbi:hypothetical protein BLTE_25420 [Blastochloris tepida]|uniref:Transposase n=1 Tax=Blastochloris tepida TaxID=2233851 RepID=A0A348G2S4_9HYPH|nr:hypothetical protein BLTE_25420 [Blastochloris tepida]
MDADGDAAAELAALKEALAAERAKTLEVAADLAVARAKASEDQALIAYQKLQIAKLERQIYGQRSERAARLIEQLALAFEELEAGATEDERAAEQAAAQTTTVRGFTRKRAERQTFPEHLPRERVVIDPPAACACCGGTRLRKIGEDVTRTLEVIPRQWKVIETVRERFSCRDCETVSQAPAPFHSIPRGWAGPSLLAMIMVDKFGQHQPLNRQAERYALEGVPIALSTMADAVGAVCSELAPLLRRLEAHVMAAERLHADDTTVPVLAKGKTDTGRCWVYVRDDRPFGGTDPPAAMFYYSRDRRGEHPQGHLAGYAGILQADAYDGYAPLYLVGRAPGPIREAGLLGPRAAAVLRHGRHRGDGAAPGRRQDGRRALADRHRDGAPDRRAVRDRAVDHRHQRAAAPRRSPGAKPPPGRGSSSPHARGACQARARARPRQGVQLHPEALGELHAVPRGWAGLPVEQRRRTRASRHRSWSQVVAVLRVRSGRAPRRRHVQPDCHGQDERHRSAGLAGRRPGAPAKPPGA